MVSTNTKEQQFFRQESCDKLAEALRLGREGAPATEEERLLFEAWMRGHCWALCATWNGKQYVSDAEQGGNVDPRAMNTRQIFAAWRDRAALAAHDAEQAAIEFPKPRQQETPCPECHLQPGERCDICGALAAPAEQAAQAVPAGYVLVNGGALQMVRNALRRDAEEGKAVRGEMLAALDAATQEAPAPEAQPYRMSAGEVDAVNRALARSVRFVDEAQAAGQDERAAFEAWRASLKPEDTHDFDSSGRGYKKDPMHIARLAFRAGAALAQRQPLTDEQIDDLAEPFIRDLGGDHWYSGERGIRDDSDIRDFARAIERAHGIRGATTGEQNK